MNCCTTAVKSLATGHCFTIPGTKSWPAHKSFLKMHTNKRLARFMVSLLVIDAFGNFNCNKVKYKTMLMIDLETLSSEVFYYLNRNDFKINHSPHVFNGFICFLKCV